MKKLSLSLLAAAAVVGAVSFAVPTQAVAAPVTNDSVTSAIAPEVIPGYYYKIVYFDYYPPQYYYDEITEFYGHLKSVRQFPDGTYSGEYYGTDPYQMY